MRTHSSASKLELVNGGNTALVDLIRAEIHNAGPISFARFMEQALYHPEHGYYSSDRAALGRDGDYLTNVSVGPAFGQLMGRQFVEIWKSMGQPAGFTILEQGAHHGDFARDFLEASRDQTPELFGAVRYEIIEPFPRLRQRQRENLAAFGEKIRWHDSLAALEPCNGIHFTNELFDALPVCLITAGPDGEWKERCVTLENDRFAFAVRSISDPDLRARCARLPSRPAGYQSEINLAASSLVRDLSEKMNAGYVIAVDYGFARHQLCDEERMTGTLQCRAGHRVLESPFAAIGESDITAHVEWTSLVEEAEARGFSLTGFTDQHHFLTGILAGSPGWAEQATPKTRRALQMLLHPEMLGRSFQVLALARNVDPDIALSGFKFAREPRRALDL